ncbi:MAG: hypothetical protein QW745_07705 [Thermoplasmata archaeon]
MKKTILKRILVLTIVFLMIISTPFSIRENINNNPYVYATTATFEQMLNSELMKHFIIGTGISAGLVFATVEAEWAYTEAFKTYLHTIGPSYRPDGPDGPDLEQFIKRVLIGSVVWNAGKQVYKLGMWIDDAFWHLVRNWVNDMYDEGENLPSDLMMFEYQNHKILFSIETRDNTYGNLFDYYYLSLNGGEKSFIGGWPTKTFIIIEKINSVSKQSNDLYEIKYEYKVNTSGSLQYKTIENVVNGNTTFDIPNKIIGVTGIVDNPTYDWNNNYTDTKVIPIPIESNTNGEPKLDENGFYLPSIDTEEWIGVTPEEIPNLDPTGTPIPDIPPFPDIENPDNDEKTGILIYIGNILQLIVGQLSKIAEGVKTIVANTNQLVFNTPSPIFDPTTGQQIDPETGEPIPEPELEPAAGDGIIGDGIDTNIPTDFEWGDFKHLLDIFFIFIYFIVILILILLKFLNVVFMSLPSIPANTELFNQYPEILEGVNFVKNLKVGGMSITVQQSFEMIFLIFFFIFAIKQIRKMYGASVFEQAAESKRNTRDMKMDYYENSQHYSPNNFSKEMLYSQEQDKSKKNKSLYNDDDYENIHFDGF